VTAKPDLIEPKFLFAVLSKNALPKRGSGQPFIAKGDVLEYEIPLPSLEEQQRVAAEIEAYQKVIDGARQIIDGVAQRLHIEPDWDVVPLGSICENLDGKRRPITKSDRKPGPYPYYGASGIVDRVESYIFDEPLLLVSEDGANLLARSTPIAFSVSGKIWVNNHAHVLRFPEMATQRFVEHYLNSISIANYVTGAAQPKLNQAQLNSIEIPLPPLEEQRRIAAELDAEAAQMDAVRALIPRFEAKIQRVLDRVWAVSSSNTAVNAAA
jgi:restriction endonuclease S subunit